MHVIDARPCLTTYFKQVSKAGRGDEGHFAMLALNQGIGAHGCAVGQTTNLAGAQTVRLQNRLQTINDRLFGRLRRRGQFVKHQAAPVIAVNCNIGESAANVDADKHRSRPDIGICHGCALLMAGASSPASTNPTGKQFSS